MNADLQENKNKIVQNLTLLGSLTAGKTLSTSSLSVIDHNSWSSSIYRAYTGEDRKKTFTLCQSILQDAVNLCEL